MGQHKNSHDAVHQCVMWHMQIGGLAHQDLWRLLWRLEVMACLSNGMPQTFDDGEKWVGP